MIAHQKNLPGRNGSFRSACNFATFILLVAELVVLIFPSRASGSLIPTGRIATAALLAGSGLAACLVLTTFLAHLDEGVRKIQVYSVRYGAMTSLFITGLIIMYHDLKNSTLPDAEVMVSLVLFLFIASTLVFLVYLNRKGDAD